MDKFCPPFTTGNPKYILPKFQSYFFCILYLIGYFQVLGVTPNADQFEIKKTYFELARKYHPGINSESPIIAAAASQGFQKIRKAYEDMLYALVDSMETTLNKENKSFPTYVNSSDTDSQDKEPSAQDEKESCCNPTPESVKSILYHLHILLQTLLLENLTIFSSFIQLGGQTAQILPTLYH